MSAKDSQPNLLYLLEDGLRSCLKKTVSIATIEEHLLHEIRTHAISRLHVTFVDGGALDVIFKQLTPQSSKDISREVLAYQTVLTDSSLGAPQLYASVCDAVCGQYWLLLENVGLQRLDHCGLPERVAAVRWAARMHATYQNRQTELQSLPWLGIHGVEFYRMLATVARCRISELSQQETLNRFDQVMVTFQETVNYLDRQPRTLIHGDLSDHNLFIEVGNPLRIRAIDWEWIAIGVGAWDLEKLLSGYDANREYLVDSYCEEFTRLGGVALKRQDLQATLHHCKILRVLWKLGCPPPPPTGITWDTDGFDRLLDEMSNLQKQTVNN